MGELLRFLSMMAASKPTSSLSMDSYILACTQYIFRDLKLRSGLFPFRRMELRPHCLTAAFGLWYSEFDRFFRLATSKNLPVLYPQRKHTTLVLKLFRREPAIAQFDQLFTPYHKSSQEVERSTGSALHLYFYKLQPAHGKLTRLRVFIIRFIRAINTRFPFDSISLDTQSYQIIKLVGSFFNRHAAQVLQPVATPCKYMVSVLFHSLSRVLFTFPLRYLFTIGICMYLALPVSSGRFTRALDVPNYSGIEAKEK